MRTINFDKDLFKFVKEFLKNDKVQMLGMSMDEELFPKLYEKFNNAKVGRINKKADWDKIKHWSGCNEPLDERNECPKCSPKEITRPSDKKCTICGSPCVWVMTHERIEVLQCTKYKNHQSIFGFTV
jgi:hypothetical protein